MLLPRGRARPWSMPTLARTKVRPYTPKASGDRSACPLGPNTIRVGYSWPRLIGLIRRNPHLPLEIFDPLEDRIACGAIIVRRQRRMQLFQEFQRFHFSSGAAQHL